MKTKLFTQRHGQRGIGWLLLAFLALLPGLGAYAETFEYDGLTVTTEGTEGTDYQKEDKAFRILSSKDFMFTAATGATTVRIVVNEGVQNAHFTLSGYNCDRGYAWIGGPVIIEKNSSTTITLADGTTNTLKGACENETMLINDGASVTIEGTGSLIVNTGYVNSAGHGAGIELKKTATLTINNGTITVTSAACTTGEGAAIGGRQYGDVEECGTLIINDGTVTLNANKAAAFGGGTGCNYYTVKNPAGRPGGTLIVNGGTLIANGRIGGGTSVNGETGEGGAGGSITINGGTVQSTMDLGSASNATSYGSIKLVGGTLTTPSVSMADGKVTINQTMTLTDNFTTSLPVSVAEGAVVSLDGGGSLNVDKSNLTLGDGASISYLYAPTLNNNYYEIYNVAQLKWFRDLVNGELAGVTQNVSANAKLMADIDLNNEEWTPIGGKIDVSGLAYYYTGNFDGNYHTISNLYINDKDERAGFIGNADHNVIKNLGIVNAKIDAPYMAGVVVGCAYGATIQGCWTSGDLNLPSSAYHTAGIAVAFGGIVKNCHTSYSKVVDSDITPTNSTANIAADAYKNGELAYLLNKYKEAGETGWGQKIGTDEYPVAQTKDNIVYGVFSGSSDYTVKNIDETTVLGTNQLAFTDYSDVSLDVDNLVYDGKCKNLVLNDAIDLYSPSAFTAINVEYNRSFSDNDFNSLYLPFGANVDDFTGCEFYVINMFHQYDTDNDGILDAISLEVSKVPSGSTLLANHPYLFKYTGKTIGSEDDAVDVAFDLEGISVEATEDKTFECSSMSYTYQFTGSSQGKSATDYADYYVLAVDENGKTVLAHPSADIPAMRWAMKMTERDSQYGSAKTNAPAQIKVFVTGEDSTTGISSVSSDAANAGIYGVNGIRKSRMTEGLNIVKRADGKVIKVVKR